MSLAGETESAKVAWTEGKDWELIYDDAGNPRLCCDFKVHNTRDKRTKLRVRLMKGGCPGSEILEAYRKREAEKYAEKLAARKATGKGQGPSVKKAKSGAK